MIVGYHIFLIQMFTSHTYNSLIFFYRLEDIFTFDTLRILEYLLFKQ